MLSAASSSSMKYILQCGEKLECSGGMVSVTVCVRFRPLSLSEKRLHGDSICIQALNTQSFTFKVLLSSLNIHFA